MQAESAGIAFVRRYLRALEEGAEGDALAEFFAPGVEQEEFPNQLVPSGAKRGLADLLEGARAGKQLLSSQKFDVVNAIDDGGRIALEVTWTGILAIPLASLGPGDQIRAHIAMFIELEEGRIISQRNYDCYEPLEPAASA